MEIADGDEQQSMVGHAIGEATGRDAEKEAAKHDKKDVSGKSVVVLGLRQPRPRLPDGRAAAADAARRSTPAIPS